MIQKPSIAALGLAGLRNLPRPILFAISLVAGGSPALAQTTTCMRNGPFVNCTAADGTYTTCNATGPIMNCNTMGAPTASAPRSSYQEGGAANGMVGLFRSIKARRVQAKVTAALKAGDCPAAVGEAFKGSDVNFALNVQSYCGRVGVLTPRAGGPAN